MIKVLHFGLSTNKGGIETYIKKIWDHIDQQKFQFSFLDTTSSGNHPCFYDEFKSDGCKFYKITPRCESISKNRAELKALFNQNSFDILHFHVNTLSYITPIIIALKSGCKVIVHSRSAGMTQNLITRVFHILHKRRVTMLPIKRVAVSNKAAAWLFGKKSDAVILNNGIDTGRFMFNKEKRVFIRSQLCCEKAFVIGHVGAFLPVKNHRLIIDIFSLLKAKKTESVLWLVGDGPKIKAIKEYAKEKNLKDSILFLGSRSDVPDLYSGMDAFIFPSYFEGFPNAVLEAQCEGLPCVISDVITQEVCVSPIITQLSLSLTDEKWCEVLMKITNDVNYDRKCGVDHIVNAGLTIIDEINNIENLYINTINQ